MRAVRFDRCIGSNILVHVDGWPTTLSQSTISPPFLPTHIIIDILSPQIINTIAIVYTHPTMKFSSSIVFAITIATSTTSAVKLRGHGGKNGNEVHQTTSRHLKASDITESSNLFVKANEQVWSRDIVEVSLSLWYIIPTHKHFVIFMEPLQMSSISRTSSCIHQHQSE